MSKEYQGTQYAVDVTPSDTVDLPGGKPRAVYVGGEGNLAVRWENGTSTTYNNVPVGQFLIEPVRILSTGTTATNIRAEY